MTIKFVTFTKINVWDQLKCPVCQSNNFVSYHYASAYCVKCNSKFLIRQLYGESGYIAVCFIQDINTDYIHIAKQILPFGYSFFIAKENGYDSGWLYRDTKRNRIVVVERED